MAKGLNIRDTKLWREIECLLKKESSGGGGTDQENIIKIPSATYSELGITAESTIEEKQAAIATFLEGYDNAETDVLFFEIKEDSPMFNFDVTGNWNLTTDVKRNPTPITNAESFKTWLESGSTLQQYYPNSFRDVVVSDFNLEENRLTANVTTSGGSYFAMSGLEITEVSNVSIGDFLHLNLSNNQIVDFNPTVALPTGLLYLNLYNNQIVDWSLSEPWANSLPNGSGSIDTRRNPTSSYNTNFKKILTSKGYTVYY